MNVNVPGYVRWPFAVLLVAHGAVHVLGFIWAFDAAEIAGLGGPSLVIVDLESGHPAVLAFGVLWLVALVALMIAGVGVALGTSWSIPLTGVAAGISLVVTVLWWSDAWVGALLSGIILVATVVMRRRRATPGLSGKRDPAKRNHIRSVELRS